MFTCIFIYCNDTDSPSLVQLNKHICHMSDDLLKHHILRIDALNISKGNCYNKNISICIHPADANERYVQKTPNNDVGWFSKLKITTIILELKAGVERDRFSPNSLRCFITSLV